MRFSAILAVAAATMVAAQSDLPDPSKCEDYTGLAKCATPFTSAGLECSTDDADCLCKNTNSLVECFDKYCPGVDVPGMTSAEDACAGKGTADTSNSDDKSGGGDEGAGASLFAPAGGLIAAIAVAVAMF
ncbi:hypothetical protein V492_03095 [Pseudogymnoascus sp. VKM F-4246]|nr:hypothetical protein V492_03095 [Pseudogymnoascus sp. VKM F-4246]